ncbi:MAG: hypothetical protein J6U98_03005 [Abditibacteriota bacterium]|nr:hypothetical protein [Abditibacteriota bacterium]
MKLLAFLILLFAGASSLSAAVTKNDDGYTASFADGTVKIGADGSIVSFKIGGAYFFEGYEDCPPGFFGPADMMVFGQYGSARPVTAKPYKAKKISVVGDRVTALFDEGEVVYDFAGGKMKVSITSGKDVFYYLHLRQGGLIRTPDMCMRESRYPVNNFNKAALFLGGTHNALLEFPVMGWEFALAKPGAPLTVTPRVSTDTDKKAYTRRTVSADNRREKINVYSPMDYQVFQRDCRESGVARLSGDADGYDSVRVKIAGKTFDIPVNKSTGGFYKEVRLPAGGWYQAEFSAKDFRTIVNHVGVGEVFVGAGQSNSTSSGDFQMKQTSGMVSAFEGSYWQLCNDPVMGAQDECGGGSYYPVFGDELYKRYKVPVGIVSTGFGGSRIEQWEPGADLSVMFWPERGRMYDLMMKKILWLGPGGFRALLWHQGEADAYNDPAVCYRKMVKLIQTSTEDAGWFFPWFVAKASYHNPDLPIHESIRSVHQKLWDNGIALPGPDTDVLTGDNRDMDGLGVHMSPKGLTAHGKMWAERVSEYLDKVL